MPIRQRLRPVFMDAFGLPVDADVDDMQQHLSEGWDSLGHMTLVVAIEDEFQVELEPDALIELDSFEKAVELLRRLGVDDD